MEPTLDWLPPFSIRHSARARSVRLQICLYRGLQLIVPSHFDPQSAITVLTKHRRWIERTWSRVQPLLPATNPDVLPDLVHLAAINETWNIHYETTEEKIKSLENTHEKQLIISGKIKNKKIVKHALQQWIRAKAQIHLTMGLQQLSRQTGLNYSRITIRHAVTRWGSCSTSHSISLNYKLLFLPAELVEYVLLHELCHTVHFNHSKQFWDLLSSFNPACNNLRKQLKQAYRSIPAWWEN